MFVDVFITNCWWWSFWGAQNYSTFLTISTRITVLKLKKNTFFFNHAWYNSNSPPGCKKMMKKNGEPTKRSLKQTNVKFLFLRDASPKKIKRGRKKNKKKNLHNTGRKPNRLHPNQLHPKQNFSHPEKLIPSQSRENNEVRTKGHPSEPTPRKENCT